jgi:hypothetical protein
MILSRGVAGTKSELAFPLLDQDPPRVALYFQLPVTRGFSLSPSLPHTKHMSYTSQQITELLPLVEPHISTQSARLPCIPSDTTELHPCSTTQPESSGRVGPSSSHDCARRGRTTPNRVTKSYYHRDRIVSRQRSRPRVAFHKYITSFFGSTHHNRSTELKTPQSRSRASSFGSKPRSSLHGSVPSVDFVSPAAFMFSGPNLLSMSSADDSMSHLPSPTSTGSERQPLSRTWTDSFSMLDEANALDEGLLEPIVEIGIVRTMSDVLFGVGTPSEQPIITTLKHHAESRASIYKSRNGDIRNTVSHGTTAGQCQLDPVACILATLLLPYLDLAT